MTASNTPSEPLAPSGSVWTRRYRVLGISKVWPDEFMVCEILTGKDAGEKRLLGAADFAAMNEESDA